MDAEGSGSSILSLGNNLDTELDPQDEFAAFCGAEFSVLENCSFRCVHVSQNVSDLQNILRVVCFLLFPSMRNLI